MSACARRIHLACLGSCQVGSWAVGRRLSWPALAAACQWNCQRCRFAPVGQVKRLKTDTEIWAAMLSCKQLTQLTLCIWTWQNLFSMCALAASNTSTAQLPFTLMRLVHALPMLLALTERPGTPTGIDEFDGMILGIDVFAARGVEVI